MININIFSRQAEFERWLCIANFVDKVIAAVSLDKKLNDKNSTY